MWLWRRSPTGRIMNRLSKDQTDIDSRLSFLWAFFLNMSLQVLTTVGVIAYSAPWFLLPLTPMAFLYFWLRRTYRGAVVQMQRIDSVSISPVFSMFSEALGASVCVCRCVGLSMSGCVCCLSVSVLPGLSLDLSLSMLPPCIAAEHSLLRLCACRRATSILP
jgi:hypothetical protein